MHLSLAVPQGHPELLLLPLPSAPLSPGSGPAAPWAPVGWAGAGSSPHRDLRYFFSVLDSVLDFQIHPGLSKYFDCNEVRT